MSAKVLTLHPDPGKTGVNIDGGKYEMIREAILGVLKNGPIGFRDLVHRLERELDGRFDGSVPWYVVTVKLDLEARGLIERVPKASPQQVQLKKG